MEKNKGDPITMQLNNTEFQVIIALRAMKPYDKLTEEMNQNGTKLRITLQHSEMLDLQKGEKCDSMGA